MAEPIYIVDPTTKKLTATEAVSFEDIGVKERQDLENWVMSNPEVLGEDLLILTCEFDRFDKATRRLDVLAMDKSGCLVVVELKLDLSGSFADQQAIRYAAFCSTMRMDDALEAFATYEGCSKEEVTARVLKFLEVDELPELNDRPRIILAAGSLDDQELTATVLWLRSFDMDISCVELTPYKLPSTGTLILVPKTIIPLPEAREYTVRVQKKEVSKLQKAKEDQVRETLWRAIADSFNAYDADFQAKPPKSSPYMKVGIGHRSMHYEWALLTRKNLLRIALHFEDDDQQLNLSRLRMVAERRDEIADGVECEFSAEPWGRKWATAEFWLHYQEPIPVEEFAPEAARIMNILIKRTWLIIKPIVEGTSDGRA